MKSYAVMDSRDRSTGLWWERTDRGLMQMCSGGPDFCVRRWRVLDSFQVCTSLGEGPFHDIITHGLALLRMLDAYYPDIARGCEDAGVVIDGELLVRVTVAREAGARMVNAAGRMASAERAIPGFSHRPWSMGVLADVRDMAAKAGSDPAGVADIARRIESLGLVVA